MVKAPIGGVRDGSPYGVRAASSALASCVNTVRSTYNRTRAVSRTRSGSMAHSCLSRPNSRCHVRDVRQLMAASRPA